MVVFRAMTVKILLGILGYKLCLHQLGKVLVGDKIFAALQIDYFRYSICSNGCVNI